MKKKLLIALIIFIGLLLLTIFQFQNFQTNSKQLTSLRSSFYLYNDANQQEKNSLVKGNPFFNFSLPDLKGNVWALTDLTADIRILVLFSSKDCSTCLQEYILWNKIYDTYQQNKIQILGINHDPDIYSPINFVENRKMMFPILHDPNDNVRKSMGLNQSPLRVTLNNVNKIIEIEKADSNLIEQKTYLRQLKTWLFEKEGS